MEFVKSLLVLPFPAGPLLSRRHCEHGVPGLRSPFFCELVLDDRVGETIAIGGGCFNVGA